MATRGEGSSTASARRGTEGLGTRRLGLGSLVSARRAPQQHRRVVEPRPGGPGGHEVGVLDRLAGRLPGLADVDAVDAELGPVHLVKAGVVDPDLKLSHRSFPVAFGASSGKSAGWL